MPALPLQTAGNVDGGADWNLSQNGYGYIFCTCYSLFTAQPYAETSEETEEDEVELLSLSLSRLPTLRAQSAAMSSATVIIGANLLQERAVSTSARWPIFKA